MNNSEFSKLINICNINLKQTKDEISENIKLYFDTHNDISIILNVLTCKTLKIILSRLRIINSPSLKKDAMISIIKTHFENNFETKLINGIIIYNTDNAYERINNILCIKTLKPMDSVVREDYLIKTEMLRRLAYQLKIKNPKSYKKELLIDKLKEYILTHYPNETIISMLEGVAVKNNVIEKESDNTSDTSDTMDFQIILNMTGLSTSTIKLYDIKLKQLHNKFNIGNDKVLESKQKCLLILEFIGSIETNDNKLAYLNAIIKYLDIVDVKQYIDLFIEERNKYNKIKFNSYNNNIKSSNFVEYRILLDGTNNIDNSSIKNTLETFLLFLSIRYPIRLSLWNMRITNSKKNIDDKKNYLLVKRNGFSFIMNDFKNVGSFGKYEFDLDEQDWSIIKNYLKIISTVMSEQEFVLYNYYKEPIPFSSPDIYSKKLKKLLKDKLEKDLTMNDIRRSYETELIQSDRYKNMTNEQQKLEHAKLLHSSSVARNCYNKV